jgi:hypothetical protein
MKQKEQVLLVTNRLQPIHRGHTLFWRRLVTESAGVLVVCVLRNEGCMSPPGHGMAPTANAFTEAAKWTRLAENNPLPDFHRLRLVSLAIASDPVLRLRALPILRSRPDNAWEKSLEDLPVNRLWVFNATKSDFDRKKAKFYRAHGEKVKIVRLGNFDYDGASIREELRKGLTNISFLPIGCAAFFRNHCLEYFQKVRSHNSR